MLIGQAPATVGEPMAYYDEQGLFRRKPANRLSIRTTELQLAEETPDFEYLIVDSTIIGAHQHAAGAKGG
ncbi:hypothetical protein GHK01_31765 [Sinorhizobium meliloti]|nr:hypothetical protein [Sinorhizobium meliloti]